MIPPMRSTRLRLRPGARRWYDRSSRYLALLTVMLTLATTVVVFFVADDDLGGLKDLVTACIGLLGLTISLQLETLFRIAERARTRERYGRLLEGVEDYPDLLPLATETLEASVKTLKQTSIPQFEREVFNILGHARFRLQELAQGRLRTDGSDNTLVLGRFAQAETTMQGTTDEGDTRWWRQEDGQRFTELSKALIAKGVRVERLWILAKQPSDDLLDLIDEHAQLGIEVFVVRSDQVGLDRRLLVNLTIMDTAFLQQDLPNKEGQAVEYLYSENAVDLERARSTFARLKTMATRYTDRDSLNAMFVDGGVP
jgi:hypothetical protein